jgi:hypothetical protein
LKIIEENEELQSAVGGSSSSDASKNSYNLLQHLSDDLKCNILNEFKLKQENTESSNESTSNQVEQQQSNTNKTDEIDLSNLKSGVYFIKVQNNHVSYTKKLIKE